MVNATRIMHIMAVAAIAVTVTRTITTRAPALVVMIPGMMLVVADETIRR